MLLSTVVKGGRFEPVLWVELAMDCLNNVKITTNELKNERCVGNGSAWKEGVH